MRTPAAPPATQVWLPATQSGSAAAPCETGTVRDPRRGKTTVPSLHLSSQTGYPLYPATPSTRTPLPAHPLASLHAFPHISRLPFPPPYLSSPIIYTPLFPISPPTHGNYPSPRTISRPTSFVAPFHALWPCVWYLFQDLLSWREGKA